MEIISFEEENTYEIGVTIKYKDKLYQGVLEEMED